MAGVLIRDVGVSMLVPALRTLHGLTQPTMVMLGTTVTRREPPCYPYHPNDGEQDHAAGSKELPCLIHGALLCAELVVGEPTEPLAFAAHGHQCPLAS